MRGARSLLHPWGLREQSGAVDFDQMPWLVFAWRFI
jgi:hypothetical protein